MKAVVYRRFGSAEVLSCEEIDKPSIDENQVLIRVRAAAINPMDWRLMRGKPYLVRFFLGLGRSKIKRVGHDVAGYVEEVGAAVNEFKRGDAVFGTCNGACAEYAIAHESALVFKPEQITFEQAAAVPIAALTALQGLRDKGGVREGNSVLVNGAAGGIGTFAVQIAKAFGAEVTGVCSGRNMNLVRSIGADYAIDYTQQNFTQGERRYDLIFDVIANHSLRACIRALKPNGTYVVGGGSTAGAILWRWLKTIILSWIRKEKLTVLMTRRNKNDLGVLRDLLDCGKIKSVIDKRYRLEETAQAIRYLEQGHARGKVIIDVNASS